ncbi:DNA polymerase III subunit delta [Lyngbya confervoides]|uniref:DNA polymerase III subunit delta n=1 Tax=Lyngbya confervoides BDU141951 TaxID=1574623 RepID=A0ABD4T6B6_9CYAN|nr:DNA polymerase III subunit delta [Lyngbya confervoides]MCM1984249.1 DNA polymerase III subunit delta [Lyngbya confervoides BDU141951]
MPVSVFWGADEFRLHQAVESLCRQALDPNWKTFNFDTIEENKSGDGVTAYIQGLNQAVTPPLGNGGRVVWLVNPPLSQQASDFLGELERTLPVLRDDVHLLLTCSSKPDGRSKIFKLLQKYAQIKEFSPIPLWQTDSLAQLVQDSAKAVHIPLSSEIVDYLVEALGNDTRQLHNALQKIQLFIASRISPHPSSTISLEEVKDLVPSSAQSSLELANSLRDGDVETSLLVLESLLSHNEPALRIIATLVRQFRTWTWIKALEARGERENTVIAKAAEIQNPKRLYFLRREIQHLSVRQLKLSLIRLHQLELNLKQGAPTQSTFQTAVIEVAIQCQ